MHDSTRSHKTLVEFVVMVSKTDGQATHTSTAWGEGLRGSRDRGCLRMASQVCGQNPLSALPLSGALTLVGGGSGQEKP